MFKIAPVIFSALVFSSLNIAMAADSNAIIKAVTVLIATTNSNGSGVIIKRAGNKYTVLTAAHVVRSTQQVYSIGTADGQNCNRSQATKVNGIIDSIERGDS
jgi:hypothetical protein